MKVQQRLVDEAVERADRLDDLAADQAVPSLRSIGNGASGTVDHHRDAAAFALPDNLGRAFEGFGRARRGKDDAIECLTVQSAQPLARRGHRLRAETFHFERGDEASKVRFLRGDDQKVPGRRLQRFPNLREDLVERGLRLDGLLEDPDGPEHPRPGCVFLRRDQVDRNVPTSPIRP